MAASLEEIMTGAASREITIGEATETGRGRGRLLKRGRGSTWLQGASKQMRVAMVLPISLAVFLEEPSLWIL